MAAAGSRAASATEARCARAVSPAARPAATGATKPPPPRRRRAPTEPAEALWGVAARRIQSRRLSSSRAQARAPLGLGGSGGRRRGDRARCRGAAAGGTRIRHETREQRAAHHQRRARQVVGQLRCEGAEDPTAAAAATLSRGAAAATAPVATTLVRRSTAVGARRRRRSSRSG